MRIQSVLAFVTLLVVAPAYAQGIRPMSVAPEKTPADKEVKSQSPKALPTTCGVFLWTKPPASWLDSAVTATQTADDLQKCLAADGDAAKTEGKQIKPDTLTLVKRHVNYKKYKRWVNEAVVDISKLNSEETRDKRDKVIALRGLLGELGDNVHDALKAQGLSDPLTAMLFTGASFADAGAETSETGGEAETGKKPEGAPAGPSAFIAFESPHFGDDDHRPFHVAFGGKIGFQQIMTMVKPVADEGGETPADQSLVADYKDGLMWSVGATAYTLSQGKSEAFVKLSLGGTRVGDSRSVLEGENGQGFIAVPANADASTSAPRWEIGLGWNYYGRPMEVAHLEKGLLNPAFSAYVMHRRDHRFKAEGDLAEFHNSQRRWIYGMSVNLRNLVRSDGGESTPSKANTFDFGFSVEREFARGSGLKIPNSTRYVLRGEVNLLRALAGSSDGGKKAETGAGGAETKEK
jgi:hypothetical protein